MNFTQDPHTAVRMAQSHAREELDTHGLIRPGVFMLVRRNPQTGARLSQPAAIGNVLLEGFTDDLAQADFLRSVREEAARLDAVAVALCVQAEAELDHAPGRLPVALVHIEDGSGLVLLHAPIENGPAGPRLGAFVAMEGAAATAASGLDPLLPLR